MLRHHFRKQLSEQNWVSIGIEFLILVVGVFLGLQAQEWSNARADRERERQIVADMLGDLKIDRSQYANAMALDLRRIAAADASLKGAKLEPVAFEWTMPDTSTITYSLNGARLPALSERSLDTLWTDVVMGYFPTPSTSTYDAMVGAGDMKIVRNPELVRSIQVYHNLVKSVGMQNDKLLTIRADALSVGAASGLSPYARLPRADYYKLVSNNRELAAMVRLQATFAIFHYGEIRSADQRAQLLRRDLEIYLTRIS